METLALAAVALLQLIEGKRRTSIPQYELHDIRSNQIDARITGRAQSATCVFCRRTITSWGGRPASRRGALTVPPSLTQAIGAHTPPCAERWLWSVLARWSTGFASAAEAAAIPTWRERGYGLDPRRRGDHITAMFARLPQSPGSEIAHEIEVALIAISRVWRH